MTQPHVAESSTRVAANVGKATFRLPPLRHKASYRGFGTKMVSRSGTQSIIYRSVPPRPLSYTFTDILDSDHTITGKSRSKTAPVSTNSPEDYAQRFKSRPTTRPKVVEFDGNCFSLNTKRRGVSGFYPSMRLKILPPQSRAKTIELPDLQLEPANRPKSMSGRMSSRSSRSSKTRKSNVRPRTKSSASNENEESSSKQYRKSSESSIKENRKSPEPVVKFAEIPQLTPMIPQQYACPDRLPDYMETPIIYPNIIDDANDLDDLTLLPPPKMVMARRDAPWVYRFKVKKNMNALSKIMASKPSPIAAQTSLET